MSTLGTRGPFGALFVALVVFLPLSLLVEESVLGRTFVTAGFTGILIAGLFVAQLSRPYLLVALVLFAVNLLAQWLDVAAFVNWRGSPLLRGGLGAAYFAYLVVVLARVLMRERRVSIDTVVGGINVYLLMGFTFAQFHWIVESLHPGAYSFGDLVMLDDGDPTNGPPFGVFLYFSFVTMTTLGYGDMSPIQPLAQLLSIAQAVVGQLYVAILIGGLVALWMGGRMQELVEGEDETADGARTSSD
ncbi:MAG: potassium channel family protein [Planctomycetota bacterium]